MDINLRSILADQNVARGKAADAIQTAYRLFRPLLGPRACRFHPTCSEYSFQSFKTHGFFKGAFLGAARILRCHPWNPGGYDPVPVLAQVPCQSDTPSRGFATGDTALRFPLPMVLRPLRPPFRADLNTLDTRETN